MASSANGGYLALTDFFVRSDNTVHFHGVKFAQNGKRLGHLSFMVHNVPFVVHMGPYNTLDDAKQVIAKVDEYCDSELVETGLLALNLTLHSTTPDSAWKALPSAYLHLCGGVSSSAAWWVEYTMYYTGEDSFAYSHLHNDLRTFSLSLRSPTSPHATWWQTDRNVHDSVVRLLARYSVPGFFNQPSGDQAKLIGSTILQHNWNHPVKITWADFKQVVLDKQVPEERLALNMLGYDETDEEVRSHYSLKLLVALVSNTPIVKDDNFVWFFEVDMNNGACAYINKELKHKCLPEYLESKNLLPDLVLAGFSPDHLDRIQAAMILETQAHEKLTAKNKGRPSFFSLARSHGMIRTRSQNEVKPDNLPYALLRYEIVPFLVVPMKHQRPDTPDKDWATTFDIHTFVSQLLLKSRITGRNLTFLAAPIGRSSVSSRAESLITRTLLRANYHVLPISDKIREHQKEDNVYKKALEFNEDDEDAQGEDEEEILPAVSVEGGWNDEVNAQYTCDPYNMKDIDFNSFYGALICIFKVDLCNNNLWETFATEWRKLAATKVHPSTASSSSSSSSATSSFLPSMKIDPFGEIWHARCLQERAYETANQQQLFFPLVEYIRKCLLMRRAFQASDDEEVKRRNQPMIDFLKSTVSAIYGAIGYDYNRFCQKTLTALITYLGRKLIQESSTKLLSNCPSSVRQVMCVTDSMAIRYPAKDEGAVALAIQRLAKDHLEATYGDLLQLTIVPVSHLLMAKRNNYARIESQKGKIVIKGFAPRRRDVPPFVNNVLTTTLKEFMLNYKRNVWTEIGSEHAFVMPDREKFVHTLLRSVVTGLTGFDNEVPDNTKGNRRFFVHIGMEDAKRRSFIYHPDDLETQEVKTQAALGFVSGCVVDYDPLRGFIVSPHRPVKQEAWLAYYLDYAIRKELIVMLQNIFPFSAIDEAVCDYLSDLPRLTSWEGRTATITTGSSQIDTSQRPKIASNFWERVVAMAEGPEHTTAADEDKYLLVAQTPKSRLAPPLKTKSEQPPIVDHSPTGSLSSDSGSLELTDIEMMDIVVPGEDPVAAALPKRTKRNKTPKKPRTTWKPLKYGRVTYATEYEWRFVIVCKSCKGDLHIQPSNLANETVLCRHCKRSIHGDFGQSTEAGKQRISTIKLLCYNKKQPLLPFDFMGEKESLDFTTAKQNWRSLQAFRNTLLAICHQETAYTTKFQSDLDPSDEDYAGDLQSVPLLTNIPNLHTEDIDRLPTMNTKYLATVFQYLNRHPYLERSE